MLKTDKMKGIAISSGIGLGKVVIIDQDNFTIPKRKISNTKDEINRFTAALARLKSETKKIYKTLPKNTEQSDIVNAYELILEDERVIKEVQSIIENEYLNAEFAVKTGLEMIESSFDYIDDEYIRQRVSDIKDVKYRILRELLGIKVKDVSHLKNGTVILCKELRVSDVVRINVNNISGVICTEGGKNSHSAIILRSMEIPTVFQVNDIFKNIKNGDMVIVNGINGEVIVNPNQTDIMTYEKIKCYCITKKSDHILYKDIKGATKDDKKIEILANVSSKMEIDKALENNADGIGLFRSEFLYVDKKYCPSEDEQLNVYRYAVKKMKDREIVIRTVDIGGDKNVSYLNMGKENNPFLGYRGIRVCLNEKDLFKAQIRAILRAGSGRTIDIMLPMVSSYDELIAAKEIIFTEEQKLKLNGISYANKIRIGIMIETPAAAIIADMFAKECDFFSVGTNDLIQYVSAIDRNNCKVSELFSPYHPSLIRLLSNIACVAKENNIDCSVCGEVSSDPLFLPILLGVGIRKLSMNASCILSIKQTISNISVNDAKQVVKDTINLKNSSSIKKKLIEFATL